MNPALVKVARAFHRVAFFRRCAKRLAAGWTITQAFHGGVICLDSVEHSWAWTGTRRLEDFEREVQDRLLELMQTRDLLLDIGSNIGVMTLSVLLRSPQARSVSIDASPRAIELLNRSLRRNGLESRAETLAVAVSGGETRLAFANNSTFTGHVHPGGTLVPALPLHDLLARYAGTKTLIKIDVEGYESTLADSLRTMPARPGSALLIELHPLGFNGYGDPLRVIRSLQTRNDLDLRLIGRGSFESLDPTQFHQLEARWVA
jgi:FkbM family methyltransferase